MLPNPKAPCLWAALRLSWSRFRSDEVEKSAVDAGWGGELA